MTDYFEIDFIEAGDKASGDAICLRYKKDDEVFIHVVDGGFSDDGEKILKHIDEYYGNGKLVNHVVLTHPDGDHAAGLKKVLEEIEVENLWMNRPWQHIDELLGMFEYKYTKEGLIRRLKKGFPHIADLEQIANSHGISINDAFQGNKIGKFTVLAPTLTRYLDLIVDSDKTPEPARKALIEGTFYERAVSIVKSIFANWGEENLKGESEGTSSENETSIVQFANLCNEKILLTGDAGISALGEAHIFAKEKGVVLPGIDRFQVPHHGSRRNLSSSILNDWLGEKLPKMPDSTNFTAIVSANTNDKDHPKKAVVRALIHRGARVIQTEGTIRTHCNAPGRGWSPVTPLKYPEDMEE